MSSSLRPPPIDPGLAAAATRAIEGALTVVAGERVLLVGDRKHSECVDALEAAVRAAGAVPHRFVLEDLAERPHKRVHPSIAAAVPQAQEHAPASGTTCRRASRSRARTGSTASTSPTARSATARSFPSRRRSSLTG